jgi:hypothetical protein
MSAVTTRATTVTCDRCGAQRSDDATISALRSALSDDGWGFSSHGRKGETGSYVRDFCPDCRRVRTNAQAASDRQIQAVALYADGLTYEQVGERLGVTRERARQMVSRAVTQAVLRSGDLQKFAELAANGAPRP